MRQPSKAQIRRWSQLGRRKQREKEGLFLAEGERCVSQILANGVIVVEALLVRSGDGAEEYVTGDRDRRPVDARSPAGGTPGRRMTEGGGAKGASEPELFTVDPDDFNRLAGTQTPQGVLAVCRVPAEVPLHDLSAGRGLLVATDAIRDPGNFGTMVRTSAWFGVRGILSGSGSVDPWNPKVVRSTAGATGVVPVVSGDLEIFAGELESAGWEILLLDGSEKSESLSGFSPGDRTLIVVGNEAEGIQNGLFRPGRRSVRIPPARSGGASESVESLNAATALGIALFALSR